MPKPEVIHHSYQPGPFVAYEIESLNIAQWSPEPLPGGQVTQVHLEIHVRGLPIPLVLRFKDPDTLTAIIQQLIQHRNEVWPPQEPTEWR